MRPAHDAPGRVHAEPGGFRLGYRPALDGLRGVAVAAVVLLHFNLTWAGGGWVGVDIFFVLSGFLITTLLVQEWDRAGAINLKNFYVRRVLRLLPAVLVLLAFWGWYAHRYAAPPQRVLTHQGIDSVLLYYANWRIILTGARPDDLLLHTWSLSVEEQFYFLWPAALWLLLRLGLRRRTVAGLTLAALAASAAVRALLWKGPGSVCLSMRLLTRADTLLAGCLTALLLSWRGVPQSRTARVVLHLAAGAVLVYLGWALVAARQGSAFWYYGGYTLTAAAVAVLLVALLCSPPRLLTWVFESSPLVALGRISYGLYLWHFPVWVVHARYIVWLDRQLGVSLPEWVYAPIAFVVTLLPTLASYYLVERPCLRLKHRWESKGTSAPPLKRAA
jgi:peptidoglycan/LPS O-acetylase OafA/YrhL